MKKLLILLMALMMIVVCASCSNDKEPSKSDSSGSAGSVYNAKSSRFASVAVGDIIAFGHYEQDNNLDNGPEPIEWMVLDIQDGKALLLSKYGLETIPYNIVFSEVTWETCSLRAWLNSDFLSKAFNADEEKAILSTEVDNSDSQGYSEWNTSGGNNTIDKVFLLSYAEANRYLDVKHCTHDDGNNVKSRVAPTEYAIETGSYTSDKEKTADGKPAGWWWLRSPGGSLNGVASVGSDGSLYQNSVHFDDEPVRPVIWVNLESGI